MKEKRKSFIGNLFDRCWLYIVIAVIFLLIGFYATNVKAAEVTEFEMGANVITDPSSFATTSTANTNLYFKSEVDLHPLIVVTVAGNGGFDNGELIKAMDATVGAWVRPIKTSGFEVLCGIEQDIHLDVEGNGGSTEFNDERLVGCKIRKPL